MNVIKLKLFMYDNLKSSEISKPIYYRKGTSDYSTFYQIFIEKEYDFDIQFNPELIIDLGANIGMASIYYANRFPNSKIICVEPEKSNFKILKKNVEPYFQITPFKRAISNIENKEMEVFDSGLGHWGFTTNKNELPLEKKIIDIVHSITISDILKLYSRETIDILKIDIEGAEQELFKSNYHLWLPNTKCIIIELHDRIFPKSSKNFFKAISEFNFSSFERGENIIFLNKNI